MNLDCCVMDWLQLVIIVLNAPCLKNLYTHVTESEYICILHKVIQIFTPLIRRGSYDLFYRNGSDLYLRVPTTKKDNKVLLSNLQLIINQTMNHLHNNTHLISFESDTSFDNNTSKKKYIIIIIE